MNLNEIKKKLIKSGHKDLAKEIDAGINTNKVLDQYLATMLWSSSDDNEEPLNNNYDTNDISKETIKKAKKDISDFIKKAGNLLDDLDDGDIGHDFWLTRNGHGAGFWDRNLGETGDKLAEIAESFFDELDVYVGDDDLIYTE